MGDWIPFSKAKWFVPLLFLIVLMLVTLVIYWPFLFVPLVHDDLKASIVSNHPLSYTINYVAHVFSGPTNGPQYRPLSYFGFFHLMNLFTESELGVRVVSFFIIAISGFSLFVLLRNYFKSVKLAGFLSLLYLVHPIHSRLVYQVLHVVKYQLNFAIMCTSIWLLCFCKRGSENLRAWLVFIGLPISILLHEASFVFPLVYLGCLWIVSKKIGKLHWALLLPSLIYFVCRMFVLKVPVSGFMSLNLFQIPYYVSYLLAGAWGGYGLSYVFPKSSLVWPFFLVQFSVVTWLLTVEKSKRKRILFFLGLEILLVLPFSALINHVYFSRAIWGVFPVMVIFGEFIVATEKRLPVNGRFNKWMRWGVPIGVLVAVGGLNNRQMGRYWDSFVEPKLQARTDIIKQVEEMISENQKTYHIMSPKFTSNFQTNTLFPALLAVEFPGKKFFISYTNELGEVRTVVVIEGNFYKRSRRTRTMDWYDRFGYQYLPERAVMEIHNRPWSKLELQTSTLANL